MRINDALTKATNYAAWDKVAKGGNHANVKCIWECIAPQSLWRQCIKRNALGNAIPPQATYQESKSIIDTLQLPLGSGGVNTRSEMGIPKPLSKF